MPELLIVVGILSLLLGLLLPSVTGARRRAQTAVCLSNLRQIGMGLESYSAQATSWQFPWIVRGGEVSERVYWQSAYGGFRTPGADETGSLPASQRPVNSHMSLTSINDEPIKVFICPADDRGYTWGLGHHASVPNRSAAWSAWGNSYPLNIHWSEPLTDSHEKWPGVVERYGPDVLRANSGGLSSRFVIAMEQSADLAFAGSAERLDESRTTPITGWHGRQFYHSLLFYDGHATHDYVDTRLSRGVGWSIWR